MAAVRVSERADFTFEAGKLDTEVLRVLRFRGTEGISELFRFDLDLVSGDPEVNFDVVGEKAVLSWKGTEGERRVHGIIASFEQTSQGKNLTHYAARLVPKVWTLRLCQQSRIFQNLSTPDILKKVLEGGGIPADMFKLSIKRSYKPRKYCVQYRESDFDFLSRLMEEEGIFYHFDHTEDTHVMVIGDNPGVQVLIPGEALPFKEEDDSGQVTQEHVSHFRFVRALRTGAVVLRDFDFKKPQLDLETESSADREQHLEYYDYPGDYPDSSLGKELVKIRLEEKRAECDRGIGESDCRRFISGFRFNLEGHRRGELNQEYLLVRLQHWGNQPQAAEEDLPGSLDEVIYHNTFDCIPAPVPYRPSRITPRPIVEGPQTAVVTGPAGEEIHTDEHGRVKVHFHWDRLGPTDDKSSCWVRVSQGWGGPGWGSMFLPRIGQEVIVEFLEGDPDRPLVTGRVYNGDNPPPYSLPGDKTKSSIKSNTSPGGGGANELRFEDAAGSEEVFVNATKDMNETVANNHTRSVGTDETIDVGKNRTKTVGVDQSESVGSNKKISVGSNHDETIGANMTLNVGADCTETIGANRTITIMSNKTETVVAAATQNVGAAKSTNVGGAYAIIVAGEMSTMVGDSKSITVGGSSSEKVGGAKSIEAGGDVSISTGAAGSLKTAADLSVTVGAGASVKVSADLAASAGGNAALKAKKVLIQADDEIILKTGSATIGMKKNGDISIEGKKISIKGSGDVTIKGSKVVAN